MLCFLDNHASIITYYQLVYIVVLDALNINV